MSASHRVHLANCTLKLSPIMCCKANIFHISNWGDKTDDLCISVHSQAKQSLPTARSMSMQMDLIELNNHTISGSGTHHNNARSPAPDRN